MGLTMEPVKRTQGATLPFKVIMDNLHVINYLRRLKDILYQEATRFEFGEKYRASFLDAFYGILCIETRIIRIQRLTFVDDYGDVAVSWEGFPECAGDLTESIILARQEHIQTLAENIKMALSAVVDDPHNVVPILILIPVQKVLNMLLRNLYGLNDLIGEKNTPAWERQYIEIVEPDKAPASSP
jgi:hypothetical protein